MASPNAAVRQHPSRADKPFPDVLNIAALEMFDDHKEHDWNSAHS
jgi:hypothetical protein